MSKEMRNFSRILLVVTGFYEYYLLRTSPKADYLTAANFYNSIRHQL